MIVTLFGFHNLKPKMGRDHYFESLSMSGSPEEASAGLSATLGADW